MKAKEYIIIGLGEGEHSTWGDCIIARANPVVDNGFSRSYVTHECSDTELFFFDPGMREAIDRIGRGGGVWTPDEDDFQEETIMDGNRRKCIINVHDSLMYGMDDDESDINSGNAVCLIANAQQKASVLHDQYYSKGWYNEYEFWEYVQSLAGGDDVQGFWQWLFEKGGLDGLKPWNLPPDYYEEYKRFLMICTKMD